MSILKSKWLRSLVAAVFLLPSVAFGQVTTNQNVTGVFSLGALVANAKLFTNAAGTGTQWATGTKVGTLTRDQTLASGNVAYTGVGFTPSLVVFFADIDSSTAGSIGANDGLGNKYVTTWNANNSQFFLSGSAIYVTTANAGQSASVNSFDLDGFTLAWVKVNAPGAGTINVWYIAFR